MTQKNMIQKLVSFESNGKDFSNLNKYLSEGWHIAETVPHPSKENVHFCVLKKDVNKVESNSSELTVKDILEIVNTSKSKIIKDNKILLEENVRPKSKEKIFEDA